MTDFTANVSFNEVNGQLVFLPCYLATYLYEGSEYLIVVSGQSGSARGQVWKYIGKA
jgi:hypothetical protein